MSNENIERLFSEKRLANYHKQFQFDKEKAFDYYWMNIQLSETFYPLLSNLEIAFRNSIHVHIILKATNGILYLTSRRFMIKFKLLNKK